ncbi:DUF4179 domain-containing protein [Clostridium sp. D2Q-11]|uniref:DUF4179 domain-containing protein n=1 Tax=Anaeromonas frigoriresistens TaxID=2683708 RepID=A0A942UTY1_9FIRM|nr:DUF4179 domain-containing protein [Anaeromonas frigoriresistens]MBS4538528.1 DUF4179 domain-containing protein [Anaeromonas frigoriresistens]
MNNIEDMFKDIKKDLDDIDVPNNLENRLNKALEDKVMKKKRKNRLGKIVAVFLVFLLIGFNFDALAFYGKKILGYDNVMNGALKELNDAGKGQIINKSYTFKNGVSVILDGIMIDETQLLAFYTIEDPSGKDMIPRFELKGLVKEYFPEGGYGKYNDERTIIKYIQSFDPPHFYERSLKFNIHLYNEDINETGEIKFKIDRDKAMGHTLKNSINKTIEMERENIHFDSILASPTRTVIKGSIQNIFELAKDVINNDRLRPNNIETKLYANGKEMKYQGGGMSTDHKGITFHKEYDPLPENLKSLKLELVSFSGDHDINKVIDVDINEKEQKIDIIGQGIVINEIDKRNEETLITITTEENTILTKVYLIIDGETVELEETFNNNYKKLKNGEVLHTRTLKFHGVGEKYKLEIKRMTYSKEYNKTIDIPIE